MLRNKFSFALILLLISCSSLPDWLGSGEDKTLQGERFAVMEEQTKITGDPSLDSENVVVPEAINTPSTGITTGNFAFSGALNEVTKTSTGTGAGDEFFLAYPPLVTADKIFIIDGGSNISAFDANSLNRIWQKKSDAPKKDRDLPGGGIAEAYGVLYASTGYGEVIALSAADGSQVWKKNLGAPLRRPPVVVDEKVFVVTIDNQLFALSAIDGATLWRHTGVKENTSFYGSASPAVKGDVVVAAYSSGEVFGISSTRGTELWSEIISLNSDRTSVAGSLNDISAAPVIVDGIVYIGGHSGELGAFNSTTGSRIWQQKLGSVDSTPWVADRFIFVIAEGNKIVALNRFDGRIKWVNTLPQPKDKDEKNFWSGPVMAGGQLIIVSSNGKLLQIDSGAGTTTKEFEVPEGIYSSPVIANGKLYMLNRDADLIVVK